MLLEPRPRDAQYLHQLLGKTITGAVITAGTDQPQGQLFLLFTDSRFEFYSPESSIYPTKGLWPCKPPDEGPRAQVYKSLALRTSARIITEAHSESRSGTVEAPSGMVQVPSAPPTRATSSRLSRFFLLTALVIAIAAALFPPWKYTFAEAGMAVISQPAGHSLLIRPPEPLRQNIHFGVTLDYGRLALEVISVFGIALVPLLYEALAGRIPKRRKPLA